MAGSWPALLAGSAVFGVCQIPSVKEPLEWRFDAAAGIVAGLMVDESDLDANRERALEHSLAEAAAHAEDAYA